VMPETGAIACEKFIAGHYDLVLMADHMLAIDQRDFPEHWPRIIGVDFARESELTKA
jgi:hypothetical protein